MSFAFFGAIVAYIGTTASMIIGGTVLAVAAIWWDKFGKEMLMWLAAIICIAGIAAYAVGATIGAGDVVVTVLAGIVGAPKLLELAEKLLEMVIHFLTEIMKALASAIPLWVWAVGGYFLLRNKGSAAPPNASAFESQTSKGDSSVSEKDPTLGAIDVSV